MDEFVAIKIFSLIVRLAPFHAIWAAEVEPPRLSCPVETVRLAHKSPAVTAGNVALPATTAPLAETLATVSAPENVPVVAPERAPVIARFAIPATFVVPLAPLNAKVQVCAVVTP